MEIALQHATCDNNDKDLKKNFSLVAHKRKWKLKTAYAQIRSRFRVAWNLVQNWKWKSLQWYEKVIIQKLWQFSVNILQWFIFLVTKKLNWFFINHFEFAVFFAHSLISYLPRHWCGSYTKMLICGMSRFLQFN